MYPRNLILKAYNLKHVETLYVGILWTYLTLSELDYIVIISFGYISYCVCFNLYCGGFKLFCNVCMCVCVCVCMDGFCNVRVS
jgi:hypothetical protein